VVLRRGRKRKLNGVKTSVILKTAEVYATVLSYK